MREVVRDAVPSGLPDRREGGGRGSLLVGGDNAVSPVAVLMILGVVFCAWFFRWSMNRLNAGQSGIVEAIRSSPTVEAGSPFDGISGTVSVDASDDTAEIIADVPPAADPDTGGVARRVGRRSAGGLWGALEGLSRSDEGLYWVGVGSLGLAALMWAVGGVGARLRWV